MHSTLQILKETEACKPGYGRMLSFFGTSAAVKKQLIPLHAIALAGELGDATWAIDNGLIIDLEAFRTLYKKQAVRVWQALMAKHVVNNNTSRRKLSSKIQKDMFHRAILLTKVEEIEPLIDEARLLNFDNALWNMVFNHQCWNQPAAFLNMLAQNMDVGVGLGSGISLDFDERYGRFVWLHSQGHEVGEAIFPRKLLDSYGYDKTPMLMVEYPAFHQIFPTYSQREDGGWNLAHVLTDTPYDFMKTHQYKLPKSLDIKRDAEKITVDISDPKLMFRVVRALNDRPVSE